jgi:hypothetical protein
LGILGVSPRVPGGDSPFWERFRELGWIEDPERCRRVALCERARYQADLVDKILSTFSSYNFKTAKALGLTALESILVRADEVIRRGGAVSARPRSWPRCFDCARIFACILRQDRKARTRSAIIQALVEHRESARHIRSVPKPKRAGEMYAVEAAQLVRFRGLPGESYYRGG